MKKYFSIDHRILFFFGYVFYLFTPFVVGYSNLFKGFPGIELYKGFFNQIPDKKITSYLLISFSWLPAFYIGHFFFSLLKPYKIPLQKFPSNFCNKNINLIAVALFLALILFTIIGKNSLFGGYTTYDTGARGKFSSLLIIFNFFLIYQLISKAQASLLLVSGCLITAFLLLSMGGRMYVFQTFIVLLIYKTSFAEKRWKPLQITVVAFAAFFIGSFSGIWRMGQSFNFSKASYSFLAEPVFTWFSTSTFLIANEIPVFNFPTNFITSFFNLIPNTFISLQPYIVSTQDMGYTYQSPLGADSLWTTLIINFGIVGSFLFMLTTGFFLNFLRHNAEKTRFGAVYYIMVCGLLPFQFFRDGFYIINKQLFFNFLLLPAAILFVIKSLQYLVSTKINNAPILQKS
jgi:oligosaccharide repeat unit polymerase